ncbi:SDR family NAD(P)-dependent oxidoreductase [Nonomuraea sp. KC401]|uniref:SDR family NAD(P)-dependent oxidoreductase n=1 Tax=Nonomuraea mesophila TaxID=2530382 RepID=A0A4R5FUW1_9ACTN|nr:MULTISPECIES: SDR family NAD(P)-dependent oxidoreductase [Nonomuraea]NBE98925.1 SDR family NAD(P)-dependent oxidoreductase [Nonomuraea sp. K271]TDE57992.1 SDR family NAD(P)-dependent oxidoreductase [Nonomuraea mesophila]TLF57642.1 SDR family NAD(P)-dependent oxidoreductase [Nonomuraea sp. KC401]
MDQLAGTAAFITGGAQGIGLGIARALRGQGVRLALVDVDRDALRAAEVVLGAGPEVATFEFDVRDRSRFAEAAAEAERRLGPISVLCNNAGIVFPESVDDMTYDLWDLTLGINLGGVINGVQTFLPRMLERGTPAHIVNTASAAGLVAAVGYMYSTSKYAVVGLSESLRNQLQAAGAPVGVTVLCPGAVATKIASSTCRAFTEPGGAEGLSKARHRVERLTPKVEATLATYGVAPDHVGDLVLEAIREDRLYVHTDRAGIDLIKARTQALLDAMPTAPGPSGDFADFRASIHGENGSHRHAAEPTKEA